ncbi:MAG: YbbR-like domain-containing protein [Oscillospiraceae bacterium]
MEKINHEVKTPLKKNKSDFFTKILAVIIAIIIWVVLSITKYPETTLRIANVPVVFSLDGTIAQKKNLSVVGYKSITTDVEIKGMKYEIGGYTDKDIIATVNLDNVTKEGTYTLDIVAKSAHSSDQCEVIRCYPDTIQATFEHISERTFPIEVNAPYITAEKGYSLDQPTVSPSEITVSGSDDNLDKIKKAEVKINDSKVLIEDTIISSSDVIFYDENNQALTSSNYTVKDTNNFDVSFSVIQKNTVPLDVDFSNCPDNFDKSSLPYKITPDRVTIVSDDIESNTIKPKSVGTIPLNSINLKSSFTFDIPLRNGEKITSKTTKAKVSFDSTGFSNKNFTLNKSQLKIINLDSKFKADISGSDKITVNMFGPNNIINNLKSDDITAEIDMSNVNKTGMVNNPITVYSKKYNNIWCYGTYKVNIKVTD